MATQRDDERRGELLTIAAELFATRGFASTTVREIADEAGILSGSLYHHFRSKDEILADLLRRMLEPLVAEYSRIGALDIPPAERVRQLILLSFDTIVRDRAAVTVFQRQASRLVGVPEFEFVMDARRSLEDTWFRVMGEGQADGSIRADLEPRLAYRFIRDAAWSSVSWYDPGRERRPADIAESLLTLVLGGVEGPSAAAAADESAA